MKITCGTDIIEIQRIKKSIDNSSEKFIEKVFTQNEINYCESKKEQKYQHYAARFAAKEAAFKAVSWQLDNKFDISWKDFVITNDKNGKPILNILHSDIKNVESVDVSLSHCKEYAIANVTILYDMNI